MGALTFIAGIVLIIIGAFGLYTAWGAFNTGRRTAEKMAPLFTSAATLVFGILLMVWQLDFWWAVVGLILFGLGYLLRGPVRVRNR
jgi:hypothetical protein